MLRTMCFEKIRKGRTKDAGTVLGFVLLALILLMAFFPFLFTGKDPYEQDLMNALRAPSGEHWFGTDQYGRDVFARVIYGTDVDLKIGFFAMLVPFFTGSLIGLLAGYYGGWVDAVVMRIQDIMTAFPFTILVIAIITILGPNISNLYIAVWLVGWKDYTKLVRSEVLSEKNLDYVHAGRSLAELSGTWRAAADSGMGSYDYRGQAVYPECMVDLCFSRSCACGYRNGAESCRRGGFLCADG